MKTKDEQNKMKMEYKPLDKRMKELSEDELSEVTGGETEIQYIMESGEVVVSTYQAR